MPAKFNLLVAASIPAVALVPLLACGGGGGGKADAPVIVTHDTAMADTAGSACKWGSNFTPVVSAQAAAYKAAGSGSGQSGTIWNENQFRGLTGGTQGSSDQQEIRILIFGGCGTSGTACAGGSGDPDATPDFPTVFTPKTTPLDLGSASTQHDVLILLLGDPDTTKYNTIYVAAAGSVTFSKVANGSGMMFAGSGSGWDFIHVDSSFMTAADGCESIVPSFSWSGNTFNGKEIVVGPDFDPTPALHHRSL